MALEALIKQWIACRKREKRAGRPAVTVPRTGFTAALRTKVSVHGVPALITMPHNNPEHNF